MVKFFRPIATICLVAALFMGALPGPVFAENYDIQATGLNLPTPEQAAWMKENLPVIQKIRLNSLALDRINSERQARGLEKLNKNSLELAEVGNEAVFAPAQQSDVETTSTLISELPPSIDNSASPAFPPVRSQGGLGSCVAWSTTYYQFTYETNLSLGRNAKGGDNTVIFSPKWTYNMINGGANNGAYFSDAYNLELKNGATSWANFPYDSNYLAWDMNAAHWNDAINYRVQTSGSIYNSNVDTMIANIKTNLANGHIMVIGTYVNSWVQSRLGNDSATAADDGFANQYVASYEKNTGQGAHGMTIVGYNDDLWCDLNGNGLVESGEKGAFKIANSWGTGDWNSGFRWITYDSLRTTSAVPSSPTWPTNDRASGGIFFSGTVYTLTVSPVAYTPKMKAEITLNQAKRSQVAVTLGIGPTTATTPTYTWTSKAVYNVGGNYAFNGSTTVCDGIFFFDFSDLVKYAGGTNRWFVGVRDSTSGDATSISSFKLYQGDALVATAGGLPKTVDGGLTYTWIDYAIDSYAQLPTAVIVADPTSGNAPLTVSFSRTGSTAPGGSITGYLWSFGDGTPVESGEIVTHTYSSSGTYAASLTVTDNKNAQASSSIAITVINPAPVASFTATPSTGNLPLLVHFDGFASSDENGVVASYTWNFGDGGADSKAITDHTYNTAGTYLATLTVIDNLGATGSTSKTITVTDPNALNAPSGLTARAASAKVLLNWIDNSSNETGFLIERGTKVKGVFVLASSFNVGSNVTTYADSVSSGTYYYRVASVNSNKTSSYSNVVSVRVR